MDDQLPDDHRLFELMAMRAVEGLAPTEEAELAGHAAAHPEIDAESYERSAAALSLVGLRVEPMPASARSRVEADAAAWLAERGAAAETAPGLPPSAAVVELPARSSRSSAWGGWLAAAAALVLAVVGWLQVDELADDRAALA